MDKAIEQALSWQVLIFCFGIVAITAIVRRVFDKILARNPRPALSYYWKEVFLPLTPLLVGLWVAAWMPYPPLVQSTGTRIFFGLTCGLFSGFLYRIAKVVLEGKGGKGGDLLESDPPPPPGGKAE